MSTPFYDAKQKVLATITKDRQEEISKKFDAIIEGLYELYEINPHPRKRKEPIFRRLSLLVKNEDTAPGSEIATQELAKGLKDRIKQVFETQEWNLIVAEEAGIQLETELENFKLELQKRIRKCEIYRTQKFDVDKLVEQQAFDVAELKTHMENVMSTVVIASPSCSPSTITAPGQSATSRCSAADQERYEDALARVERYEREVMDLRRQLRVQGIEENRALDFKKRAEEAEEANVEMKQALTRAQDNNRHLFDAVQDLKGNLRVMCRIRPQIAAEDGELQKLQVSQGKNSDHLQVVSLIKRTARSDSEIDHFTMERVFEMAETNKQIFTEVGQLVGSAMNGRNVCVFAYGQTGSGKTHTMTYPWNKKIAPGGDVDSGIIPSSVELISNQMSKRADSWKYSVTGKYVEIYAEKVYDLLRDNFKENVAVALKFNVQKSVTVFWAESTTVDLTKDGNFVEKVKLMLTKASKNRRTRATEKNLESSRSHSVLSLRIVGERIDGKRGFTDGTLNLIDLAGSERPSTTDSASQKEGIAINLSLSTLRKILKEMADPTVSRFSFRESTLTKLLSSSLGEGCRIMMFVMISPSAKDRDETRNTLQFAIEAQRPS